MKVTFPHLGNLYIVLETFFVNLGIDVIAPPPVTKKTIELGSMHSPEFACFPLKINVGNFIEALEKGADTIIMAGGVGPCRFGYYSQVQKEILIDLGYKFDMIIFEPPKGNMKTIIREINKLFKGININTIIKSAKIAWTKAHAIEKIESKALYYRAREKYKGTTTKIYKNALKLISESSNEETINKNLNKIYDKFKSIDLDTKRSPLKIGLVGEIYTLIEPSSNMNIENILGNLGVEVIKSIKLTEWANSNIILDMLRIRRADNCTFAAKPYLNYFVGGHGVESVGETIIYARKGLVDGVIHLAPFTCMPEIIAQSILYKVSKDKQIPVMTVMLDEHSAETGFQTRIEAFVDLLNQKREAIL